MTELKKIGEPVRDFYRRQGWEEGYKAGNAILVKAVESAKALERERIIKIIDEQMCLDFKRDRSCDHGYCWCAFDLAKRLAVSDEA